MSTGDGAEARAFSLHDLEACFGGAIPAVLATTGPDGMPNVTYVSRAHRVDHERIALSNQFMSKTARNIAVNPRGSLLLIDPATYDEYRLSLVYERTERRGHVFEHLRREVDEIAAITGMQSVFRLRAADIFRVVDVEVIHSYAGEPPPTEGGWEAEPRRWTLAAVAELTALLGRCTDLDTLVDATLDGLDRMLGFRYSHLMLLDEEGRRLYNIGSHGFDQERVGAEVEVGDGLIGAVAERCAPMRVGNLRQMAKYSRSVRRQFEDDQRLPAGADVPLPELTRAESRLAVPAMARGELVGVLTVDSALPVAFSEADQHVLGIVACTLASAIEHLRRVDEDDPPPVAVPARHPPDGSSAETTTVRFFPVDGSTFLGNDYLIKGVAGRILWALLRRHVADHRTEFSNKELRLDPTLELPGFKDNLESRLILLKRRLDEREAPVRIERIARGRFRLQVETAIRLHAEGS